MSCKLDPNSKHTQAITAPFTPDVEPAKRFYKTYENVLVSSTLSSLYAATGFPFDVRTINKQAGRDIAIRNCFLSNGLLFTSGTAFVREWVGIYVTCFARSQMRAHLSDESWNERQGLINFASGASRALCDAVIGNPVIIAKQTVFLGKALTGRQALLQRYEEEKNIFNAFYRRTFLLTALRNCTATGLQLMCFAHLSPNDDSRFQQMMKGGGIGLSVGIFTFPIDRTRNFLMHDKTLKSWRQAILSIYKTSGIRGFYSGYSATVCKMFASGAISSFGMRTILQKDAKSN